MAKSAVKILDSKVSYRKEGNTLRVIVLGKIERWKEATLIAWLLAWTFCGIVVANEWFNATDEQTKVVFFAFLVFWA